MPTPDNSFPPGPAPDRPSHPAGGLPGGPPGGLGGLDPLNSAGRTAVPRFDLLLAMARHWWLFALRGVAALLFGLVALLAPGAGLALILAFLAAWLAVDGVFTLAQAIGGRTHGAWFWVDGIVSLLAAAFLFFAPAGSAYALVLVTAIWAAASGLMRLVLAFRSGNVLLGLVGALGIFLGAWMVLNPGPGLLALIWLVGFQALLVGALLIGLAFRLRHLRNNEPAFAR